MDQKTTLLFTASKALERQDMKQAVEACQILNREYPDFHKGWVIGSQVALKLGNPKKALEFADKAITLKSTSGPAHASKAQILFALGDAKGAKAHALKAMDLAPQDRYVLTNISRLLSNSLQDLSAALPVYETLTQMEPNVADHWYNLAAVYRYLGRLEDAEVLWTKAIKLGFADCEVYYARTHLRKQTADNNHAEELEGLLTDQSRSWRNRMHLHYALGKEYEDLERYDEAFHNIAAAGALRRKHMQYDVTADV